MLAWSADQVGLEGTCIGERSPFSAGGDFGTNPRPGTRPHADNLEHLLSAFSSKLHWQRVAAWVTLENIEETPRTA